MLVSVAMPAFNGAAYIGAAIESALGQTWSELEVVVVDDGSSDQTPAICRSYGERVRLIQQPNDGTFGIGARARAIFESRGEWIATLDQDDLWQPNKIERQLARATERPAAGAIFSGWRIIDAQGNPTGEVRAAGPEGDVYHHLLTEDPYCHSAGLIRRDVIARCGLPDTDIACGDWDLWLRIARRFEFAVVEDVLTDYRVHGENWSQAGDRMSRALWECIRRQEFRLHPGCAECRSRWRAKCFAILMYRYELAAGRGDGVVVRECVQRMARLKPLRLVRPRFLAHLLRTASAAATRSGTFRNAAAA